MTGLTGQEGQALQRLVEALRQLLEIDRVRLDVEGQHALLVQFIQRFLDLRWHAVIGNDPKVSFPAEELLGDKLLLRIVLGRFVDMRGRSGLGRMDRKMSYMEMWPEAMVDESTMSVSGKLAVPDAAVRFRSVSSWRSA